MEISSLHITNEITFHIVLIVIIAIATPLFTIFGLKKEIKLAEQVLAILVVFIVVKVIIFAIPYIILPFR